MENIRKKDLSEAANLSPFFAPDAFSRLDENEDGLFYTQDRFLSHLDSMALQTVEGLIGGLVFEEDPVILDLMAGWDSHLPEGLKTARVVGLGLNERELAQNRALEEVVLKDINNEPSLPFEDNTFDLVLNTVSVDYLVHPAEIFKEVGRTLKPGGLFMVIFSNRMFPQKAVKVWRESSEEERILLVEDLFKEAALFEKTGLFVSKGRPRPSDDKYADKTPFSDPVYAVYANKKGGGNKTVKATSTFSAFGENFTQEELKEREKRVKETMRCPHCGDKLKKWTVPDNPFGQTWDNDFMYICFNDECPYFVRGWDHMYKEGNRGCSYRLMYNPDKDRCLPVPVPSPRSLKDGIVE